VVLGIGHTTLASLVGYRWELYARGDADLVRRARAALFAAAEVRRMTVEPDPGLPRGGFTDLAAEAGVRVRGESRVADLFVSWERRNDVFLEEPGARRRAQVGVRFAYNTDPRGTSAR
jgi:hypothetical protein